MPEKPFQDASHCLFIGDLEKLENNALDQSKIREAKHSFKIDFLRFIHRFSQSTTENIFTHLPA